MAEPRTYAEPFEVMFERGQQRVQDVIEAHRAETDRVAAERGPLAGYVHGLLNCPSLVDAAFADWAPPPGSPPLVMEELITYYPSQRL